MKNRIRRWWANFVLRYLLPAGFEPYRWANFKPATQIATARLNAEFVCEMTTAKRCDPETIREMAVRNMKEQIMNSLFKTDAVVVERVPAFHPGVEKWRATVEVVLPTLTDRQRREKYLG